MWFGGKLKGEMAELGLRGSEARIARGLEKRVPKSELGRRSGALGRFSEGMLLRMNAVSRHARKIHI